MGRLGAPHGLRGELKVKNLVKTEQWGGYGPFINQQDEELPQLTLRGAGTTMLVKLDGVDTPEDAARYKGAYLYTAVENFPELAEDEVYLAALYGQKVHDHSGAEIGTVRDLYDAGSHPALVVALANEAEAMVPLAEEYVQSTEPVQLTEAAQALLDIYTQ